MWKLSEIFLNRRKNRDINIAIEELCGYKTDLAARLLAWNVCVDMIAQAIGRCEFRTYLNHDETFGEEYYLWNVDPNTNQSSTAFLHKLIHRLYNDGEALIIQTTPRGGREALVVADSFKRTTYPAKQAEYTDVKVDDVTYRKTFRENDVLYFTVDADAKTALDALGASYQKFITAAAKLYEKSHGKKWIVHVNQMAAGDEDFEKNFANLIKEQFKPFNDSEDAILPEFDGYEYRDVSATAAGTSDGREIRNLIEDVFDFTARSLHIDAVLINGKVEGTKDAQQRTLTSCIDPLADQIQEEIIRKRYGFEEWRRGNYLHVDTSAILHFDLFANSANVEKLLGSGITFNDILGAAGYARCDEPWADRHFLTKNIGTVEDALSQMQGGENV